LACAGSTGHFGGAAGHNVFPRCYCVRVDPGSKSRALIAAIGFAVLTLGFVLGVALGKWVFQ
jgi:hypothetical protein